VKPEELHGALVCGAEDLLDQIRSLAAGRAMNTCTPSKLTLKGWIRLIKCRNPTAIEASVCSINAIELQS
jgi:hypothetical protein